jgi:hypothetical protein
VWLCDGMVFVWDKCKVPVHILESDMCGSVLVGMVFVWGNCKVPVHILVSHTVW